MADLSLPEDRSAALGYIYTAISLGFVVGPMTGGILADRFGTKVPILLGVSALKAFSVSRPCHPRVCACSVH